MQARSLHCHEFCSCDAALVAIVVSLAYKSRALDCAGDHQFNERACLGGIEFNSLSMPGPPCGGKVGIEFRGAGTSTEVFQVIKTLDELNKTDLVILGVGLWDKMVVSECATLTALALASAPCSNSVQNAPAVPSFFRTQTEIDELAGTRKSSSSHCSRT